MTEATALENQELGGRYVIERELGRGGTSTVYLAHDRVYDRRVAVKVLRRELALSVGPDRFLREIRVTARLNHPHIAPVIDSGVGDGWCFFVSTFFEGGTLRQRLERERQLPVDDAISIARAIAGALDYAHAQRILHCDVKPENILFSNGEAFLTDFGIARLFEAGLETTSTGIVRGTPAYMSPEQAGGEKGYDGRTDIYSLACVLYEALAGVPAFVGATPQAVLAQRFLHAPRDLRVYRPTVPRQVEAAIARATALSPDDRFATAGEFAAALTSAVPVEAAVEQATSPNLAGHHVPQVRRFSKRSLVASGATAVTVIAAAAWMANDSRWFSRDGEARTASFDSAPTIVFPFARDSLRDAFNGEDLYLHDALVRWRGLRVIDVPRARQLYASRDSTRFGVSDARRLARQAGARRFIWGRLVDRGGTNTIVAGIYDARGADEPIRITSVPIPAAGVRDSVFDYVASTLAFGPSRAMGETGLAGTRSTAAKAAYSRGIAAATEWELGRADSAFVEAVAADPDYSQALLWRALVAGWRKDTTAWRDLASDAIQREKFLGARDRALARALYFHSSSHYSKACPIYRQLAATDAQDFTAWFGLAECLRDDEVVISDSSSASGWRFRASYAEAIRAYQRAFALMPTVSREYQPHTFASLQELLFTLTAQLRRGHSEDDAMQFAAYPGWDVDSLAFIPYPLTVVNAMDSRATPPSAMQAIEQTRRLFRQIAESWARALPRDSRMLEALAIGRDLQGDATSVDVLRQAVRSAAPNDRLALIATLVWLQTKYACGAIDRGQPDTIALAAARGVADSLLDALPQPWKDRDIPALTGLAALTGRPALSAKLVRRQAQSLDLVVNGRRVTVSARIVGQSAAFLMFAAFGAPNDSIVEAARRVDAAIRSDLSEDVRDEVRQLLLTQPVALAYPAVGRVLTLAESARRDYLLAAEDALEAGDGRRVKRLLREVRAARRHLRPADLRSDALYPEAWLLSRMGDHAGALAWISPPIDAIANMPPQLIEDPANLAALGRAILFRADLESRYGETRAGASWLKCVSVLWARGDAEIQQLLKPNGSAARRQER